MSMHIFMERKQRLKTREQKHVGWTNKSLQLEKQINKNTLTHHFFNFLKISKKISIISD